VVVYPLEMEAVTATLRVGAAVGMTTGELTGDSRMHTTLSQVHFDTGLFHVLFSC
jgi:hypothetical protein